MLTGGVVKVQQSLSQKSKIFDSSLYTREPLRMCRIETNIKVTALWEFHRAVISLEVIFIREMLHYIFNTAIENIAKFVYRIHFDVLIMAQAIQQ